MSSSQPVFIATRGSALALAQANQVLQHCRALFPGIQFDLKIIKTTGDKLQTINLTNPDQQLTKGLFTKELEVALLTGEADFAVHSLKDLPTELPPGLRLAAVSVREDVRDVLLYRGGSTIQGSEGNARHFAPQTSIRDLPSGAVIATSSTRRQAQLLALRPDLATETIRGNVGTRLRKLWSNPEIDGILLAMAGLKRLGIELTPQGEVRGVDVPQNTFASVIPVEEMLPCVGQAALGYECREGDTRINSVLAQLNDAPTFTCTAAERAFLQAMGGGCLSPVAAWGRLQGEQLCLRAVSFREERVRRTELSGPITAAEALGRKAAAELSC